MTIFPDNLEELRIILKADSLKAGQSESQFEYSWSTMFSKKSVRNKKEIHVFYAGYISGAVS